MDRKVYLIAGHNGKGSGASSKYLDEGSETIILRDLIALNLTKYNFFNYVLDNGVDTIGDKTKLNDVVNYLKKNVKSNDLCIDIHFNALNEIATGTEVLIPFNADKEEKKFANDLLLLTCSILGLKSRGVKDEGSGQHSKLAMLSSFNCKNILLEVCFCTNKNDCDKYYKNREKLAEKIALLIIDFCK